MGGGVKRLRSGRCEKISVELARSSWSRNLAAKGMLPARATFGSPSVPVLWRANGVEWRVVSHKASIWRKEQFVMLACSCSYSISLLRKQVRSRSYRFPSIQAIVWSTKLGTCNRTCNRLGTVLVLAEAGREYVKTAVPVCKAQFLLWATQLKATCTEKLSDRWVNKCRAPEAASVRPASLPVRAGVDRLHHVVTCRPLALFSQTRHQARTQPSLSVWTHPTGLTHLPLRP